MTRYRCIILFIICMMLLPNISKAECNYERQAELSRIASNIQLNYSYEMNEGYPKFTIHITNASDDIYLKDEEDNIYIGNSEYNINSLSSNNVYNIYSNDDNCKDEFLLSQYINLPSYNMFSGYDECKKYPNIDVCSLWGGPKAESEYDFYEKIKEYENTLNKVSNNSVDSSTLDTSNKAIILSILGCILIIFLAFVLKKVKQ